MWPRMPLLLNGPSHPRYPHPSIEAHRSTLITQTPESNLSHTHKVWFPLWNNRIGVDSVAFSYARVVQHHEWWRILTASHAHFEPFHLLFNVMALWYV